MRQIGLWTPNVVGGVITSVLSNIMRHWTKHSKHDGHIELTFLCPNQKWCIMRGVSNHELNTYIHMLRSINATYRYKVGGMVYSSQYTDVKGESLPYKIIP